MISINIDGKPIPWKRPGRKNICNKIIVYDKQAKEKEQVRWQVKPQYSGEVLTCPMLVDVTFFMPIPKSASKKLRLQMLSDDYKHISRPDVDNMVKFYFDALTGVVFGDDAQICELNGRKKYGLIPSVLIKIHPYYQNVTREPIEDTDYLGLDFDY